MLTVSENLIFRYDAAAPLAGTLALSIESAMRLESQRAIQSLGQYIEPAVNRAVSSEV